MTVADEAGSAEDSASPLPGRMVLLGHDIRSAMSDVIGGVRLIDRDHLSETALAQVERVEAASELLARLIEEVLGGAPREAVGAVGNLNLTQFLDDELRRWHGAAQGTGTRATIDRAANVPEIVRLDRLQMRRIVANLMGNALRHAEGGRIVLRAGLGAEGALEISVCDDGPGFDPDLLSDLFRPAMRGPSAAPGTGMGLHIADFHARAMGGRLEARNREEGGACVILSLPAPIWRREPEEMEGGLPDLSGRRVLVADDSETNRTLVRAMLTRMGAECELASDGIEALNWLARERFDLALLDIEMPVLGGIEVLRSERLRQARGIAPPMAMVAMTAYVMRDSRDAILEAGADGIIAKPLGAIEVFGRDVRRFIDRGPDAAAWRPDAAPALSAATLVELMKSVGPEFEGQLLARLSEDLERVDRRLRAGVAERDLALIAAQVHILLSLSGAVGALPTQEAARRLDRLMPGGDVAAILDAARISLARLAELRAELAETE